MKQSLHDIHRESCPIILRLQKLRIVDKFNKQTNNNIGTFMTRSLKQ